MACANKRIAHQRRFAGSPPSHRRDPPWRTPQLAGRPVTAELLRCRGETFVQRSSTLLGQRSVQLVPLLGQRSVQLVPLLGQRSVQLVPLLFECPFGVAARGAAAKVLCNQRTDQGEEADAGCDDRRHDLGLISGI
jgi:hypothetical protein